MEKLKRVTGQKTIHHLEIIKTNILSKIHDHHFKNVTSRASTSFPLIWPGELVFYIKWPNFKTRPRNHQDKHFEQYLWWLFQKCDIWSVNSFLLIWPGHLVFDPMWPSFKLDLEIIKTNILSKIHDDCLKNVTARVLTRFSADLAQWPSFWPHVTQFQTWNHQDKHFEQDSWGLLQKCDR